MSSIIALVASLADRVELLRQRDALLAKVETQSHEFQAFASRVDEERVKLRGEIHGLSESLALLQSSLCSIDDTLRRAQSDAARFRWLRDHDQLNSWLFRTEYGWDTSTLDGAMSPSN